MSLETTLNPKAIRAIKNLQASHFEDAVKLFGRLSMRSQWVKFKFLIDLSILA